MIFVCLLSKYGFREPIGDFLRFIIYFSFTIPNMIHICPNKIYCSKSKKNIEIQRLLEHDFCVFAL